MQPGPLAAVEEAPASAGRTAIALAVVLAVAALAVLPVAIASGAVGGGVARPLAAWLGGLAALVGGVKLAVAAWGLLERVRKRPWLLPVVAPID